MGCKHSSLVFLWAKVSDQIMSAGNHNPSSCQRSLMVCFLSTSTKKKKKKPKPRGQLLYLAPPKISCLQQREHSKPESCTWQCSFHPLYLQTPKCLSSNRKLCSDALCYQMSHCGLPLSPDTSLSAVFMVFTLHTQACFNIHCNTDNITTNCYVDPLSISQNSLVVFIYIALISR